MTKTHTQTEDMYMQRAHVAEVELDNVWARSAPTENFVDRWAQGLESWEKHNGPWAEKSRHDFIRALLVDLCQIQDSAWRERAAASL